jgi:hypothetical protein
MPMLIRRYNDADGPGVRALFIRINRALASEALRQSFEAYIAQSLDEEIDRIPACYAARPGACRSGDGRAAPDGDSISRSCWRISCSNESVEAPPDQAVRTW